MNHSTSRNFDPNSVEGEYNIAEMLCSPRAARLRAGVFAGIFAGTMMLIFGMIVCAVIGKDILAPFKIMALPTLGIEAMAYHSVPGLIVGTLTFYILMSLLGMAYAHVTGVNNRKALFGMGLTWGIYGWIFITCLMMPSFRTYMAADIHRGVMFFAWLVYGISLMSVSWFDRVGYQPKKK